MDTHTWLSTAAFATFVVVFVGYYRKRSLDTFPPGPPALPIIGNILSVKPQGGWHALTEYRKTYGDLIFFHGFGNNILVLNSMKTINDLLDKRGEIYSDRPVFTVVGELMGLGQSLPLLPYGKEWRECRKLAHVALSATAIKKYHRTQEDMAALLNKALLQDPTNFFSHVRTASGRIILSLTYGFSVEKTDEQYITHAEKTMHLIGEATVPGAFLCDFIPMMKYLPSWFPFQRKAIRGKQMIESLVTRPFEDVKQRMAVGLETPSLTQDLLSGDVLEDVYQFEHRVKWTTGALFGAGAETTYATVLGFILAMALNPEKQKAAQAEIDRVIGGDRLPIIEDRENLPYVDAVIKEVLRWHPSLPLSIARMSSRDDVYEGYLIPKGTIVLPNVWAIVHAETDANKFIPERFLGPRDLSNDPAKWAFGFGRRICPGKALAENSLFAIIAGILSAFDIRPPLNADLNPTFGLNLVSYPDPFECQIIPRSLEKSELVQKRADSCQV